MKHFHPEALTGNMYSSTYMRCGALINTLKAKKVITGDAAEVTCKRCLKAMAVETFDSGLLAGAPKAMVAAARAENAAKKA